MSHHCCSDHCQICHSNPCKCHEEGHCCGIKKEHWKHKLEEKINFHKLLLDAMEEKDTEKRHMRIKDLLKKKLEKYESYLKKLI